MKAIALVLVIIAVILAVGLLKVRTVCDQYEDRYVTGHWIRLGVPETCHPVLAPRLG